MEGGHLATGIISQRPVIFAHRRGGKGKSELFDEVPPKRREGGKRQWTRHLIEREKMVCRFTGKTENAQERSL